MKNSFALNLFALLVITLALPAMGISQKAYVTTKYQGTSNKLTVTFTLADGYFPGNEIKLYNKPGRKNIRFLPENDVVDETLPTKFYHYSPSGKKFTDYFLVYSLKENYKAMPAKIGARYFSKTRPVKFILTKK